MQLSRWVRAWSSEAAIRPETRRRSVAGVADWPLLGGKREERCGRIRLRWRGSERREYARRGTGERIDAGDGSPVPTGGVRAAMSIRVDGVAPAEGDNRPFVPSGCRTGDDWALVWNRAQGTACQDRISLIVSMVRPPRARVNQD